MISVAIFGEILGPSGEIFLALGNIPIWGNFKQANIFDFLCYKQKKIVKNFFFKCVLVPLKAAK
jgi:hypothetical protein